MRVDAGAAQRFPRVVTPHHHGVMITGNKNDNVADQGDTAMSNIASGLAGSDHGSRHEP